MSSRKKFRIVKIMTMLIISLIFTPIFSEKVQAYQGNSEEVEGILQSIIKEYGQDNIIFEDGIILEESEELSTTELTNDEVINWKSIDENIAEIINENTVKALFPGTTFLIGEKDGKYHVKEVYIPDSNINSISLMDTYSSSTERKASYVVYLDPGHGGSDPGAIANGLNEKDINLQIALKLRDKLQSMGIVVKMSRDTDKFVSLADIVAGANAANPDVFISIHQNSFTNTSANGIETYWYKGNADKNLANTIQSKLISSTNAYNRGVKQDSFYVVKNTTMPSVLIECGFITNVNEANLLKTSAYQTKISDAIANGTYEYLQSNISLDPLVATRVFGQTRYETSYEIFKMGWSSSDYAIIAPGSDYPDALCAAPLASKYNAPILLANNTSLKNQPELLNLLKSKGVKNVFIVGGTGVIPSSMESELSAQGITSKRLGGKTRYETAIQIAKELGSTTGEIAIVSGLDFADGLSISPVAASRNMPILLTNKNTLPTEVSSYINSLKVTKTYIIGSSGAVSDNIASKLTNVERLGGKNRYETNKSIFNKFKSNINLENIYIASGLDFPDALSVSALAGKNSGFVLLSNLNSVEASVKEIVTQNKQYLSNIYVLGSKAIISDNVLYNLGIDKIK